MTGGTPEVRSDRRMYVTLIQFLVAPPGDKQARKPRSYASPKLLPTHSLADRGEV